MDQALLLVFCPRLVHGLSEAGVRGCNRSCVLRDHPASPEPQGTPARQARCFGEDFARTKRSVTLVREHRTGAKTKPETEIGERGFCSSYRGWIIRRYHDEAKRVTSDAARHVPSALCELITRAGAEQFAAGRVAQLGATHRIGEHRLEAHFAAVSRRSKPSRCDAPRRDSRRSEVEPRLEAHVAVSRRSRPRRCDAPWRDSRRRAGGASAGGARRRGLSSFKAKSRQRSESLPMRQSPPDPARPRNHSVNFMTSVTKFRET